MGWREAELVERIAVCTWRLRRLYEVEASVFAYQQAKAELELARGEVVKYGSSSVLDDDLFFGDGEKRGQAVVREEKAERSLDNVSRTTGAAFIEDARSDNAIGKLSWDEASLERSYRQASVELERLRAARKHEPDSAPITIDVAATKEIQDTQPVSDVGPESQNPSTAHPRIRKRTRGTVTK